MYQKKVRAMLLQYIHLYNTQVHHNRLSNTYCTLSRAGLTGDQAIECSLHGTWLHANTVLTL